jgi:hypothetical protein
MASTDGAGPRAGARRRVRLAAVFAVVVLAVLGFASFELAGHLTGKGAPAAPAAAAAPAASAGKAGKPAVTRATAATVGVGAATAQASPPAPPSQVPAPVRVLVPASAVAFGPSGTADGDDPQDASSVLAGSANGWLTRWYTTPVFGGLQTGTGLLLDMGRTVTITAVRLTLGSVPGAAMQLRLGAVPSLADLRVAQTATTTADVLDLPLAAPIRARYVLVWFTSLPPDGAGTYRVLVHRVTVQGRP